MADATTTNYGWTKPTVGADDGTWGGLTNANWDGVDSVVWSVSGVANSASTAATAAGTTAATALATANTALSTANGKLSDAPTTGGPYGRQAGAWVALSSLGVTVTTDGASITGVGTPGSPITLALLDPGTF